MLADVQTGLSRRGSRVRVPSAPPVKLLKYLRFLQLSLPHPPSSAELVRNSGASGVLEGTISASTRAPVGSTSIARLMLSMSASVVPSIHAAYILNITSTPCPKFFEHHSLSLPISRCQVTQACRAAYGFRYRMLSFSIV